MKLGMNMIATALVAAAVSGCTSAVSAETYTPGYAGSYGYDGSYGNSGSYGYAGASNDMRSEGAVRPAVNEMVSLSAQQLDQLTGPIALYPDPLLAQVLPAATFPDDIADAARYVTANPQPTEDGINAQTWDPSVKAIVHYPTVLRQMSNNMEWTQALGAAFVNQQSDVMASIQRLRSQAQVAGTLGTTPQQQVVADAGAIQILPANPQVMYVPTYDPQVAYVQACPVSFSPGFQIGLWLDNGCDWGHHRVTHGHGWGHHWSNHQQGWGGGAAAYQPWVRNPRRPLPVMPRSWAVAAARTGSHPWPSANARAWTPRAAVPRVATPQAVAPHLATPRVSPWVNRAPQAPRITPPARPLTAPARVAVPPHRLVTPQWRPQAPAARPTVPVRPAAPVQVGPSPAMRAAAAQRAVQAQRAAQAQAAARAVQARAAAAKAVQAKAAAASTPVAKPQANPFLQQHRR